MKVSIFKVIKSDLLSLVFLAIPLVLFILYIDSLYFGILSQFFSRGRSDGEGDDSILLGMMIISAVILWPILFLRIKKIINHFQDGIEVVGTIIFINLWKDRGRIEYTYQIDGESHKSIHLVHRNKFVNSLQVEQQLLVIVSKQNHKKALIKDMYVK